MIIEKDKGIKKNKDFVVNYELFQGKTIDCIDLCQQNDLSLLSIKQIILKRLKLSDINQLFPYINSQGFTTFDGILNHPNGSIKVVLNSQFIKKAKENEFITKGNANDFDRFSIQISEKEYSKAKGYEFNYKELCKYTEKTTNIKSIKNNPILLALVNNDKNLMQEYIKKITNSKKNHIKQLLNINIDSHLHNYGPYFKPRTPKMPYINPILIGSNMGNYSTSSIYASSFVGNSFHAIKK